MRTLAVVGKIGPAFMVTLKRGPYSLPFDPGHIGVAEVEIVGGSTYSQLYVANEGSAKYGATKSSALSTVLSAAAEDNYGEHLADEATNLPAVWEARQKESSPWGDEKHNPMTCPCLICLFN